MLGQLVGPEIEELLKARAFAELRTTLTSLSPATVAEIFADMPSTEVGVLFRILPREFAADIFEYIPFEVQEDLLHSLGQEQVAAVLNEMAPDDRTALLEELPGAVTQRLLTLLSAEERAVAKNLLGYPEESIGRLMTPEYVAVRPDWTAGQVIDHIRKVGRDKETLNVIYVIDDKGRLIDDIRLRELILADPNAKLADLMDRQYNALRADQDQEDAVREFSRLDRVALPVVDTNGILVGMITVDDVMDVAEQEVTEDMQRMGGMEALDAPYLSVGMWEMLKKRGGWLSLLFLGEMLTASAMSHYEHEIAKASVLSLFLPLIISSGGNSGSQASTLVIRSLALRELSLTDWLVVARRELTCGLVLGLWLGTIGLIRIHIWQFFGWAHYTAHYHLVAVTVLSSLVGVVLWGTIVGSMLPFLLRKMKLDPATISAPFVATMVDVCGLIIYFTTALVVLRGTLL